MKIQNIDGTERNETRQEILARHADMMTRHAAAMVLLESFHTGPYFDQIAEENRQADREEAEQNEERGLTTEINRSTSLVSVSDTVESCADILRRHRYGYKNGSRDSKGRVVIDPYTPAENEAAEKWLASLAQGGQK